MREQSRNREFLVPPIITFGMANDNSNAETVAIAETIRHFESESFLAVTIKLVKKRHGTGTSVEIRR